MPLPPPVDACSTLFPTAIGRCGIAWAGASILATHLPEASDEATLMRLAQRAGVSREGNPPREVRTAIDAIIALLEGARVDLGFIACDFGRIDPFSARVYQATRAIPPGETLTYGEIAAGLGDKRLAQAVGQALGRNPWPIIVPCHRVLGASGRLTGFSANGGTATKLKMLAIEGARIGEAPGLFDDLPLAVKQGS
jgi:methylated-DNA-[protein]-cysteine S-methyltransferase